MLAQTEDQRGDGLSRLRHDLESGTWDERHRNLLDEPEHDCGYRLLVAAL